jgi:hypothetical protein
MRLGTKLGLGARLPSDWERSRRPFVLYLGDYGATIQYGEGFLLENRRYATLSAAGR